MKTALSLFLVILLGLGALIGYHTLRWEALPETVMTRSEASAITYKNNVYVFNGFAPNIKIENSIERFDPVTSTWTLVENTSVSKGTAMTHNGLINNGADVWLIGGRVGDHPGKVTDKVWIYNIESGEWRAGPTLPTPVAGGGAALINDRIHWFGGLDPEANCDVGSHYVLELSEQDAGWTTLPVSAEMPEPRNHFATVVIGSKIYAIGGQFGHDNCEGKPALDTKLSHVFDTESMTWSQIADLPSKQSHMEPSSFEHAGHIIIAGGEILGNEVWRYTPETDHWETIALLPRRLLAPVARIFNDQLYIAGGGAPSTRVPTRSAQRLNLDLNTTSNDQNTLTTPPGWLAHLARIVTDKWHAF